VPPILTLPFSPNPLPFQDLTPPFRRARSKSPRNRVHLLSAPRLPQTRCGHTSIAVRRPPFLGSKSTPPRPIPFPYKPLSRNPPRSPNENASTYAKPAEGVPENAPQPRLGSLRTAIGVNAVRRDLNLGSTSPAFPRSFPTLLNRVSPVSASRLPSVRLASDPNPVADAFLFALFFVVFPTSSPAPPSQNPPGVSSRFRGG